MNGKKGKRFLPEQPDEGRRHPHPSPVQLATAIAACGLLLHPHYMIITYFHSLSSFSFLRFPRIVHIPRRSTGFNRPVHLSFLYQSIDPNRLESAKTGDCICNSTGGAASRCCSRPVQHSSNRHHLLGSIEPPIHLYSDLYRAHTKIVLHPPSSQFPPGTV